MKKQQRADSRSRDLAEEKLISAKLRANPRLAQAYIEVTQKEYDEQVKSGKLSPAKAKKVKVLLKACHREMTSIIVRHAMVKTAKRVMRVKAKRRLEVNDVKTLRQCLEKEIPALQQQLKDVMKDQRAELETFLENVKFEALLQCERFLVQHCGKAEVRKLLVENGGQLLADLQQKAKRGAGSNQQRPRRRRA